MTSVVAIGGGHGLAATLRALRGLPVQPTAVVSVADDGGSTGRLRADSNRAAPGDIRRCLLALAAEPNALTRTMDHRFTTGELEGHAFGNLLIAAMEESEGSLVKALEEISSLIPTVGRVLPATGEFVELVAELGDGRTIKGQVAIANSEGIRRVHLEPAAPACPSAIDAIADADLILLGPGSLFTSVLAAAVVPGIPSAIATAPGQVVYVSNLHPQHLETEGFSLSDHVGALVDHDIRVDAVLFDPQWIGQPDGLESAMSGRPIATAIPATVGDDEGRIHQSDRLTEALRPLIAPAE